jgi:KDO2-lipid IV(A) lauroyltransferase
MMTRFVLLLLRLSAALPLPWLRAIGRGLGCLLYHLVASRRRVVLINLTCCFPELTPEDRQQLARQVFVRFAQAWLDRGWLWHGKELQVRSRLRLIGQVDELFGDKPTVLFAPHFVGLDAGWTGLTQQLSRHFTTIYTNQSNAVSDAWILRGRQRFGSAQLFGRADGVKSIVTSLREGSPLYLLPDMNFGPHESIFVPFYGVPAATVPSLSRFARLGRAKVVPVITRMTEAGYDIEVLPAWSDYPGEDLAADTVRMNQVLEEFIGTMPDQYYWVHKRFKDQPPGWPDVYKK